MLHIHYKLQNKYCVKMTHNNYRTLSCWSWCWQFWLFVTRMALILFTLITEGLIIVLSLCCHSWSLKFIGKPEHICWCFTKYEDVFCMKTKAKNTGILWFIGNYVIIVLVQPAWHLIRLYASPEPKMNLTPLIYAMHRQELWEPLGYRLGMDFWTKTFHKSKVEMQIHR